MFASVLRLVVRFLAPLLGYVAAALLFILMIFTCVDVFGRYFFNRPVIGGFELTQIFLAVLIFAGLPLITLRNEQITVDLFDSIVPKWARGVQYAVVQLVGALITALLARQLWGRGDQLALMRDTTVEYQIPLSYVAYTMSILMGVTALVFVLMALAPPRPGAPAPKIE
jgi:TRAP-type C4-dicarboxylate transport system permease small subunit